MYVFRGSANFCFGFPREFSLETTCLCGELEFASQSAEIFSTEINFQPNLGKFPSHEIKLL